ncbi:hypothetical protein JKP88DRAFT_72195 [Tribonema minus]|uniref:Uncharacterized protein n=1 Tax=Tribonema minus TaxID=303371 RepID=A0A836CBL5_9STRA|nr:hypothetical protein JKP88DRAFT_72195 [Tribonema minus]
MRVRDDDVFVTAEATDALGDSTEDWALLEQMRPEEEADGAPDASSPAAGDSTSPQLSEIRQADAPKSTEEAAYAPTVAPASTVSSPATDGVADSGADTEGNQTGPPLRERVAAAASAARRSISAHAVLRFIFMTALHVLMTVSTLWVLGVPMGVGRGPMHGGGRALGGGGGGSGGNGGGGNGGFRRQKRLCAIEKRLAEQADIIENLETIAVNFDEQLTSLQSGEKDLKDQVATMRKNFNLQLTNLRSRVDVKEDLKNRIADMGTNFNSQLTELHARVVSNEEHDDASFQDIFASLNCIPSFDDVSAMLDAHASAEDTKAMDPLLFMQQVEPRMAAKAAQVAEAVVRDRAVAWRNEAKSHLDAMKTELLGEALPQATEAATLAVRAELLPAVIGVERRITEVLHTVDGVADRADAAARKAVQAVAAELEDSLHKVKKDMSELRKDFKDAKHKYKADFKSGTTVGTGGGHGSSGGSSGGSGGGSSDAIKSKRKTEDCDASASVTEVRLDVLQTDMENATGHLATLDGRVKDIENHLLGDGQRHSTTSDVMARLVDEFEQWKRDSLSFFDW